MKRPIFPIDKAQSFPCTSPIKICLSSHALRSDSNTFSGGTTISAGTLKVNNTLGSGTGAGAVAINSGGILGGNGTISGAVTVNGTISPGNSPGTLNTGAATYNGGGSYVWEVNNATGTKGGDPGYDWHNITGNLTIGSSSGTPFNINVTGLNTSNVSGVVSNWNPNAFSQFTLATASGGITSYSSDKFAVSTGNFTNNNPTASGAFSVQQSGNDLVLVFNSAGGGTGSNGLVQGLGIMAADNASQSVYSGGSNLNTLNGGFGYGAWSANSVGSFAGSFVGDAKDNAGGGSGNFINTTGAKSLGLYANTQNTATAQRAITNGLTVGQTLSLDFDNGYSNNGNKGIAYFNSAGNAVLTLQLTGSSGNYQLIDASGTHTLISGFTGNGMHTELTQTGNGNYTITVSGTGFATQTYSGTLLNPTGGQSITQFQAFNSNGTGGAPDGGNNFNVYINSPIIALPTWNGQSVGAGGGNITTGTAWAAHSPVSGGSIAFDGAGSTVNNDTLTSVYNIAFNATGALGNTNNTTNAGAYTLTGNALTINGGIDNNSTNLQTINNNLTLGANQTFSATNGALALGGTLALNSMNLTVNAANAVTENGVISGSTKIFKTGAAALTLSGNNTFSGQMKVANGSVIGSNNNAFGTNTSNGTRAIDLGLDSTDTSTSNNVAVYITNGITNNSSIYVAPNTSGATRTIGLSGAGSATFQNEIYLGGNATLTGGSGTATFSGKIVNTGGIIASGGTVNLTGANTYNGTTTVTGGTLLVNGSTANGSAVTVNSSGTLGGNGTVGGSVTVNGTLSPGNSPGTLSTGAETWNPGGNYNWQVLSANGTAGTGYDTIAITGNLSLSGLSPSGKFNINLWSLSSIGPDVSGNATNFNNASNYTWTIASTTGGSILGFDRANFNINTGQTNGTGGFSNGLNGGSFDLLVSGNNLNLTFTAVPEPSTGVAMVGKRAV